MSLGPGTYVTDRVRLVHKMRGGAMGSVWIADHETLKSQVVVKLVSDALLDDRPDARSRFAREASVTALIKSPHVIQIYDYGEMGDGTPYMVMELLEGESLHERIEREGVLSPQETAEILRQMGNALDLAHARGIIHRDIKPQNIFLSTVHGEPLIKVLDFGIAKRATEESVALTTPGMVVGTVYYVSPERLEGEGEADYRTDLWALAVVAYKVLTGQLPFVGHDMVEVCTAIREGRFRRPSKHRPELPESLDSWFVRAFYPDADARFTSAAQMARVFKEALEHPVAERTPDGRASAMPAVMAGAPAPERPRPPSAISALMARLGSAAREANGAASSATESAASAHDEAPSSRRTVRRVGLLLGAALVLGVVATVGWQRCARAPSADATTPGPARAAGDSAATAAESGTVAVTATAGTVGTASPSAPAPPSAVATAQPSAAALDGAASAGMIAVPAGPFWMGCDADKPSECAATERPGREVVLQSFLIDRTEVSTSEYGRCVEAGACTTDHLEHMQLLAGARYIASPGCNWGRPERAQHPVNCLDYDQAATFCRYAGKRLPTEAEWEKAARGNDRRTYPWGTDPPSCAFAVMSLGGGGCGRQGSWPVGTLPGDRSPYGVLDLGGNVREWVGDWYADNYYQQAPASDPPGPTLGALRSTRGGSWTDIAPRLFRATTRGAHAPTTRSPAVGVRCARNTS